MISKVSTMYNDKMLCIIWRVLSHSKEGISHHFQNFSRTLIVDRQNKCGGMVSRKSPSFERCKEGDLPLLNFSNLTCMKHILFLHNLFILKNILQVVMVHQPSGLSDFEWWSENGTYPGWGRRLLGCSLQTRNQTSKVWWLAVHLTWRENSQRPMSLMMWVLLAFIHVIYTSKESPSLEQRTTFYQVTIFRHLFLIFYVLCLIFF